MTLDDILQDIYALEDEMRTYERKYGILSETFYESYVSGEEPRMKHGYGIGPLGRAHTRSGYAGASSIRLPFNY